MPLRRRERLCRIEETELAGVPCFWSAAPPPYTATLIFRVGRSDETLTTSGITHLCEHLLMPAEPPRDLDRNARVEDLFAVFWATGNERRALRFLEQTAELIRKPPLDRLETERKILQAEAAGRGQHAVNGAAAVRYGAMAHGLVGFDEYGLNGVEAADVSRWIEANFTRQNAVLWLTGPPPRELALELPEGTRKKPPEPEALPDIAFPAVFGNGPDATVIVSVEGARSPAFSIAHAVVVDRAWKQIRYEQGLAYDIGDWFEPLTGRLVGATYWIESLEANEESVRASLLGILESVAENGATSEELEREVDLFTEAAADPTEVPGFLHFAATEHLLGEPFIDTGEWLRRRREVTSESTAAAYRSALERMLLLVPEGTAHPEGFHEISPFSTERLEGKAYRPKGLPIFKEPRKARLMVGDEGVTLLVPDGELLTVRWDSLVTVLRWADGSRTMLGSDGFRVHVDPDLWRHGDDIVQAIDARSPDGLVVVMEPALTSRVERVEEAARANLKRRWVVTEELEALPGELDEDEQILSLAEANRGLRAGLIVATDQRVLWLCKAFGDRRIELSYDEIGAVEVGRKLGETRIDVETAAEKLSFTEIAPKERAAEIQEIVRERTAAATRTFAAPA
jgi:zinc protease